MRKTDKKIDKQISIALTDVCENALEQFTGFEWLTHLVNYSNFPSSLKVVCVFDTNDNLGRFLADNNAQALGALIQKKLFEIDVVMSDTASQIAYDTEEQCQEKDKGKWAERLSRLK